MQAVETILRDVQVFKGSMSAIVSMEVYNDDWVCMELRELGLTLNLRPSDPELYLDIDVEEVVQLDEDGKPFTALATTRGDLLDMDVLYHDSEQPLITLATKRVYTQIGRLQMLEELTLGIDSSVETCRRPYDYWRNLVLDGGWLGELAGLKNLRRLWFRADFWSSMGLAEVQFMHEHWPLFN